MIDLAEELMVVRISRALRRVEDLHDDRERLSAIEDDGRCDDILIVLQEDGPLFARIERRAMGYEAMRRGRA